MSLIETFSGVFADSAAQMAASLESVTLSCGNLKTELESIASVGSKTRDSFSELATKTTVALEKIYQAASISSQALTKMQKAANTSSQALTKMQKAANAGGGTGGNLLGGALENSKNSAIIAAKVATFVGGAAIDFGANTNEKIGETRRTAERLRMPIEDFQAWQQAVKHSGGTEDDFNTSIESFRDGIKNNYIDTVEALRKLDISPIDDEKNLKSTTQLLLDVSKKLAKRPKAEALDIGEMLGFDVGTSGFLHKGVQAVQEGVSKQKKIGVFSKEQAEVEQGFTNSWDESIRGLEVRAFGMITDVLKTLTSALEKLVNTFDATGSDDKLKKSKKNPDTIEPVKEHLRPAIRRKREEEPISRSKDLGNPSLNGQTRLPPLPKVLPPLQSIPQAKDRQRGSTLLPVSALYPGSVGSPVSDQLKSNILTGQQILTATNNPLASSGFGNSERFAQQVHNENNVSVNGITIHTQAQDAEAIAVVVGDVLVHHISSAMEHFNDAVAG